MDSPAARHRRSSIRAFTLVEVVMAIMVIAVLLGGMTVAYTQATRRAQWSGYALAATALSVQTIEQARAAIWDPAASNKNEIVALNLMGKTTSAGITTGYCWTNLDLPISGSNYVRATNYVRISTLYLNGITNPPVQVQMVRVDTVWPFRWGNTDRLYTNTVSIYCAPDNRESL